MLYRAGRTSTYPEEPVDSGIRFHFLGGAGEVGNVGCVIEDQSGTKVLMDYGLAPTKPPKYPSEAPLIDHAIITHSHIDHIGMAPWLVGHHGTTLHGSRLTSGLSEIMWRDTYKVSSIEGYPLAWDRRDLDAALEAWQEHDMDEEFSIGSWNAKFHVAGHIPGAVMTEIDALGKKVLWTGEMKLDPALMSPAHYPSLATSSVWREHMVANTIPTGPGRRKDSSREYSTSSPEAVWQSFPPSPLAGARM